MDSQLIDFSLPSEYTSMLEERTKERDAGMMNINLILVINSQYSFYKLIHYNLLPYHIQSYTIQYSQHHQSITSHLLHYHSALHHIIILLSYFITL